MKKCYLLLCLFLPFRFTNAQIGNLDSTFGVDGIEKLKEETYSVSLQKNPNSSTINVSKYIDRSIDFTFGISGNAVINVPLQTTSLFYNGVFVQDDGKLLIVGNFKDAGTDYIGAWRLNVNGTLDSFTTFKPMYSTGSIYLAVVRNQQDEIHLHSYYVDTLQHLSQDFVHSFSSRGIKSYAISPLRKTSPTFKDYQVFSGVKSVAIQGDKVIVSGPEWDEYSPQPQEPYVYYDNYYLSKYSDGKLDPTFGNNGRIRDYHKLSDFHNMLLTPTEKLIVADFVTISQDLEHGTAENDFRVMRFNKDGTFDKTFNGTGIQTTDLGFTESAQFLILQGDKIIVGGSGQKYFYSYIDGITYVRSEMSFAIARYNNNGSLDSTFSEDGKQTLGAAGAHYFLQQIKIEKNRLLVRGDVDGSPIAAAYLIEDNNIVLNCPENKAVPTDKGVCSALVNNIDPIINPSGSAASVSYTLSGVEPADFTGSASGTTFNKGETTVTYKLVSDASKTCSFQVTVEDKEAPAITNVSASPSSIWPPNHKMTNVEIKYALADNCGAEAVVSVSSNEPESGTDKDDEAGDWKIIDAHHVQLRAERSGKGDGRVYTITITATDAAGNKTQQQVNVTVPHDSRVVKDKNEKSRLSVRLLSNPTKSFFVLELQSNNDELVSLRVIDIFGRIVETRSGISPNGRLQVGSGYGPGIYFAELSQGNKKEIVTMIKL